MAENYQERADRRASEYKKIRCEAFRQGYDMAIGKLRSEVERAVSSNYEIMAAYYTEAADWLDANRPPGIR